MSDRKSDIGSQTAKVGSYSASLIGTIRSHLEGLQGYDVMALELIQNADDAGSDGKGNQATKIVFDVTDAGLVVRNDGEFTYCGDLGTETCPDETRAGYACDYHRITEVASGGKLSSSDNTGRFGIGFVSTYQIADHPQIHSAGIQLTLMPERGTWQIDETQETSGTKFFLPWASDPESDARIKLGASNFTEENLDQLISDFRGVLRKALLFLRRLRRAELRRNGRLVFSCDLDRDREDETELLVSFGSEEIERWVILRADATEAAPRLTDRFPQLATLKRKTPVSIGIRVEPQPVSDDGGLLYAYLPTEQSTGLPVHINADFFPEADRKAVIFAGNQHQQAWNELLIETAAGKLADSLELLRDKLGSTQLWALLSSALRIKQNTSDQYPKVFDVFWEAFKTAVERGAEIAETAEATFERPQDVLLSRRSLEDDRLGVLQALGGKVASENLRAHRNALVQLGTKELGFIRLVELMAAYFGALPEEVEPEELDRVNTFYIPLWGLTENLLFQDLIGKAEDATETLKDIPFLVDPSRYPTTINVCYRALHSMSAADLDELFPDIWFASDRLSAFPNLCSLIEIFDLSVATAKLNARLIDRDQAPEDVIGTDSDRLSQLYLTLATLSEQRQADEETYRLLKTLPIWSTARGFASAEHALLPGDFSDPIGQTSLVKQNLLDPKVRQFLRERLGVERQTIDEYVRIVVPRFIGDSGPADQAAYRILIETLANHPSILDNSKLRRILTDLPIVPTRDGDWARPGETYFRTDELAALLGEAEYRWVHVSRAGESRAVHQFLDSLSVRWSPSARHLAERMISIADEVVPTEEARKASEKAFYEICRLYQTSADSEDVKDAIAHLKGESCFPAHDKAQDWYAPDHLYAPFRFQAFESQANVLDFKNTQRLNRDLLDNLGIAREPTTELVVSHLLHCVEAGEPAHVFVYQILNERAKNGDQAIHRLCDKPCIYLEEIRGYVRPNQIYLIPQQLGKYTYNAPASLGEYKSLFTSLGVKERPGGSDYVDIVLDIVHANYAPQTPLSPVDRQVYDTCMASISAAWNDNLLAFSDIKRLRDAPSVPNTVGHLRHADEILLRDSEYHLDFFGSELDVILCQPVDPSLTPFLEHLGVQRLSDVAEVQLDFVDGPANREEGLCEALMERSEILARMLHDQPHSTRTALDAAIRSLAARSHDTVRIQATISMAGEPVSAEPADVKAFYDPDVNELVLARPITDRSWVKVFSALLHQLMPEEPASHISHLALALQPLMGMSLADAEDWLAEANVPYLEAGSDDDLDLRSQDVGGFGVDSDVEPHRHVDPSAEVEPDETEVQATGKDAGSVDPKAGFTGHGEESPARTNAANEAGETEAPANDGDARSGEGQDHPRMSTSAGAGSRDSRSARSATQDADRSGSVGLQGSSRSGSPAGRKGNRNRRGRTNGKSLWDRALISYARQKKTESNADEDGAGRDETKYKLAIEAASRAAVCAYEKGRGREADEMPQTHPGYDIISRNVGSEEIERYIEVKGTSGEWNKRGVGLSRLQFNNAQDFGDRFWLYVVEFALDEEDARVHAIQSPAIKVEHFMFDGGWRDAAVDEAADPTIGFVVGARIDCGLLREGVIEDVQQRGHSRLLIVQFDDGRKNQLLLNLKTMRIIEADDGNDDS